MASAESSSEMPEAVQKIKPLENRESKEAENNSENIMENNSDINSESSEFSDDSDELSFNSDIISGMDFDLAESIRKIYGQFCDMEKKGLTVNRIVMLFTTLYTILSPLISKAITENKTMQMPKNLQQPVNNSFNINVIFMYIDKLISTVFLYSAFLLMLGFVLWKCSV